MQRNIHGFLGFSLEASDGEIGKLEELYFDDQSWTVRYLIVKTGNWLNERKVLISPDALMKFNWEDKTFPVNLTKEQIRNSPDIDTDKPVSRQHEAALYGYYPWQPYWGSGFYAGGLWDNSNPGLVIDPQILTDKDKKDKKEEDIHLRSTRQVTGYQLHATDGEIGHVSDFIIDDQTWKILYFIVETKSWWVGNKVLISVQDIKSIAWIESEVFINLSINSIKRSKPFDPSEFTQQERGNTVFEKENF